MTFRLRAFILSGEEKAGVKDMKSGMFHVDQLAVGGFDHNFSYLITTPAGEAALVDPTGDAEVIRRAVEAAGVRNPKYILLTHSHPDHYGALDAVRSFFAAPVYAHPGAAVAGTRTQTLFDGQCLPLGEGEVEVIFTPGHSLDSVCYRLSDDSGIFTGDTLFVGCCGYCDPEPMFRSMQRLRRLADGNVIYSGHDYGLTPTATIGEEKYRNPFLSAVDLNQFKERLTRL